MRTDGRSFSCLTEKNFQKPFDPAFHKLDEISLILPPSWDHFDRRVEKILSLSASIFGINFTQESGNILAQFDSRISTFEIIEEIIDYCV